MIFDLLIDKYKNADDKLIAYCRSLIYICMLHTKKYIDVTVWGESLVLLNSLYLPNPLENKSKCVECDAKHIKILKCHLSFC
jgi:hypothetical protein